MQDSDYSAIEALLNAKEGENIQFKEARNRFGFDEVAIICCALSNDGGGKLVLGITDKRPRKVVGSTAFPQPERDRVNLMNKLKIQIDFDILTHEDKRILVFTAARRPVGLPIQYDGKAWAYYGDSLQAIPSDKLREIYQESGHDFSSDICPGAGMKDLDPAAIEAFRQGWVEKSGNQRIRNMSAKQLLLDCEAVKPEGITYAALILFGTYAALGRYLSQAEIIFEYRANEASGPAQQREEFRVGFFACYEALWQLINLRNNRQHYQEGLFLRDVLTFNERVVREALLNAMSHRNYQLANSIFVRQYQDRLVIENPGGLPDGITLDNMLDRQYPRNRLIASILARCGLVERSGQGMNLIYELSIMEAKALPEFTGSDAYFFRIILHGLVLDKEMLAVIGRIGEERLEAMSTDDLLVVHKLFRDEKLPANLRGRVTKLVDMGIVQRVGRKVILARRLYASVGKAGVYTRRAGLDKETNKELILKHLRGCGEAGSPMQELQDVLPGYSRGQLQWLLKEMRRDGQLCVEGKTRGARWFLAPQPGKEQSNNT